MHSSHSTGANSGAHSPRSPRTPRPGSFTPRPHSARVAGGSSHSSSRSGSYSSSRSGGFSRSASGGRSFGGRPTYGSRPSFGNRGGFGGNRGGGRKNFAGAYIDPSRFINRTSSVVEEIPEYVSQHQFNDFAITDALKRAVAAKGYVTPTPIQDAAIPHVLLGKDIVGIANTGTGKTAAFLIPLINKILGGHTGKILIIVPTRELALQIEEEFHGFAKGMGIYAVSCIGGASISQQMGSLRRRYDFVIGTPGRLKDLNERRALDLSRFSTIVLDEADRMLDMGFVNDMKYLMSRMPTPRHTLFFSATMSREIEGLIGEFLKDPVKVSVKTRDTSANVDQDVIRVADPARKFEQLVGLFKSEDLNKVLVFGRTKHGVEKIARALVQAGVSAESIHGDRSLGQRKRALESFKLGKVRALVATDVAARGLDIRGVSHVINYDVPATYEDYVHRIGRTGRAGQKGKAVTFVG